MDGDRAREFGWKLIWCGFFTSIVLLFVTMVTEQAPRQAGELVSSPSPAVEDYQPTLEPNDDPAVVAREMQRFHEQAVDEAAYASGGAMMSNDMMMSNDSMMSLDPGPEMIERLRAADRKAEALLDAKASGTRRQIEAGLKRVRTMRIVYSRPKILRLQQPTKLVLTIASSDLRKALERAQEAGSPFKTASAPLAEKIRAELEAPDALAEVQEVGAMVKPVTDHGNVTFTWYVTPKEIEDLQLTLRIYNLVTTDVGDIEIEGPAYSDTFHVTAPWWERVWLWVKTFGLLWTVLATGLGAALLKVWEWSGRARKHAIHLRRRWAGTSNPEDAIDG